MFSLSPSNSWAAAHECVARGRVEWPLALRIVHHFPLIFMPFPFTGPAQRLQKTQDKCAFPLEPSDLHSKRKRSKQKGELPQKQTILSDPVSKQPLALVRHGVAPVQKWLWVLQKTLGRP